MIRELLLKLRRGDCWCEVGIDNPMMRGRHSATCEEVRAFLAAPVLEAHDPAAVLTRADVEGLLTAADRAAGRTAPHTCVACGHVDGPRS